ncbi:molybdopterin adenylyltransferase [Abditibacterium utsteinense]|uniref:Molybdenum cofactor biosynthesis protein B n=1 Tax=Abditibacterium utsteinense TaxID=1960156 RepID=A0A2S8SVK2_9BACT|nr:MogA/MoaB family molybdenum cofactor biosynthesis protein [Abditibacterium utsteinense]PQV64804.1 molybdopterin adenylyltransferase [Abditibacterium utsteinense]
MSSHPTQQSLQPEPGHKSPSTESHREQAPESVRCFVLVVSDTRTLETDGGGALIESILTQNGHEVVSRQIVRDEIESIRGAVNQACGGIEAPDAILVTGGSGIGPRDLTPEALRPLLTKELPGFGEVFRVLSFEEIGAATMLSRAFAGVIGRTLLFVLPGSTNAVKLAMEKLIAPEIGHLVREVRPESRK